MTDRIKSLERLITAYQASYYDGEGEISDAEFDALWDELKILAPGSPVLQKVGTGRGVDGFPKAKHVIPMGSQEKASCPEEFLQWAQKTRIINDGNDGKSAKNSSPAGDNSGSAKQLVVQYKLDGASLELQYKKGNLKKAVTRGDGIIGDEITANALKMAGVPAKIDIPFTGGVRGEVVMSREIWKKKYPDKANCRNAANGIMRRKDASGCEDLELVVYDASGDVEFKNELDKVQWLKKRGFAVVETAVFSTAADVIKYREKTAAKRDRIPFDIDGLVVKDMEIDLEDLRRDRPEKQIAFKFDLETAYTVLREVEWSESGATYTPIGIVDPVRLAGTTVQRANLNNPDMIRAMGLKIGSLVAVVKRGEIIPKIEGLAPERALSEIKRPERTEDIPIPEICGTCGASLVDSGSRLYCPNAACPKRLLHRLEKWVNVLGIRELGEKLISQLFEKGRVRNISDLYSLTEQELAEYDRMGSLSAAKVIRHIQAERELSLAAFVAGFDFENVAETTMEKITLAGFDTLEKLRGASVPELAAIHGLGEITASVIVDGVKETAAEMDNVLKAGVISIAAPSGDSLPLRGLSFCFTGELKTLKRDEAKEKIKSLGAQAKDNVVRGLSYLVTNDTGSGSAKNKKAKELGVAIINEEEFIALLNGGSVKKSATQGELF